MRLDRTRMENMLLDYLYEELEPSAREAFEEQLPLHPDLEQEVREYREVRSWVSDVQEGAQEEPMESHRLEQIISSALAEGFPAGSESSSPERKGIGQRLMEWIHAPQLAMAFLVTLVAGIGLYQVEKEAFISTSDVPRDDAGQRVEVPATAERGEPNGLENGKPIETRKVALPGNEEEMEAEEFVELERVPEPAESALKEPTPKASPTVRRGSSMGKKRTVDLQSAGNTGRKKTQAYGAALRRKSLKKERAPSKESGSMDSFGGQGSVSVRGSVRGSGSLSDKTIGGRGATLKNQNPGKGSAKRAQSAPMAPPEAHADSAPSVVESAVAESDNGAYKAEDEGVEAKGATPSVVEPVVAESAIGGAYKEEGERAGAKGTSPNEQRLQALEHLKSGSIEKGMAILETLITARDAHSAKALTSGIQMLLSLEKVREAGALMALGEQTGNSHDSWPMALEFARTLMKKGQP